MKRIITCAESLLSEEQIDREFDDDYAAYDFCDENNIPYSDISFTDQGVVVSCVAHYEYTKHYIYSFDVRRKFGTKPSTFWAHVENYSSPFLDYTDLNKEYKRAKNAPTNCYIDKSSIVIRRVETSRTVKEYTRKHAEI